MTLQELGMSYVDASGLKKDVYHETEVCLTEMGCVCGLCPALKGIAAACAAVLGKYGKET